VLLDKTLAAAFIDGPARHVCLGVKLPPFSLWHRFLLRAFDSPLFKKGQLTIHDLRLAVGVCRLKPFQCRVRKPSPGFFFLWHGLQAEVDRFYAYCGDYISRPEWAVVPPPRAKGGPPPEPRGMIPDDILVVADIIAWSGWDEEVVWALQIGRAYWYQMCAQRAAGLDVDFTDEIERAFREELRQHEVKRRDRAAVTFSSFIERYFPNGSAG